MQHKTRTAEVKSFGRSEDIVQEVHAVLTTVRKITLLLQHQAPTSCCIFSYPTKTNDFSGGELLTYACFYGNTPGDEPTSKYMRKT